MTDTTAGTRCASCGVGNPPAARFCDQCGAPMPAAGVAPLPGRSWEVGRDPGCDVVIDDHRVSARHCRVTEHSDGLWLEDLGSANGTFVNRRPVTAAVRIHPGDRVTLGTAVPLPPLPAAAAGRERPPLDRRVGPPAPPPAATGRRREVAIGRDPDNDVVLDYPMVSGRHARICLTDGRAVIEDLGSTNGTAIGGPERKLDRPAPLAAGDTVYFGSLPVPASRLLTGNLALGREPHTTLHFSGRSMVLGRDPGCDLVLEYPMVSGQHARLERSGEAVTVEDLGSTNGTFVNGRRVSGRRPVEIGDVVALGSYSLRLTAADRLEQRDYRGNVTVESRGITVEVPGRRLIEDVSLTVYPSELVGLMGPSGCGKSTLLHAINGYSRPAVGEVLFNQHDLYGHYDQFRMHIGYVPQDDILHRALTVRQALYYSARLRLPRDFTGRQIHQRISQTLAQLGLVGTEDTLVGSPVRRGISGGQRKRVNLAMELLSEPFVLFLDEPTSGLSSEDALAVMKVLRDLADGGKTILLSIHQPSRAVFRLLDSVAILAKDAGTPAPGRLVYFGPAYPDAVHYFNRGDDPEPSPDLLLQGLAGRRADEWAARWGSSRYRREYVEQRAGTSPAGETGAPAAKVRRTAGLGQWWTLVRRCLAIKAQDRWHTGILVAQAPVIAALIVLVFGNRPTGAAAATTAPHAVFLTVVAALWFGASNSAREIVGEWAIYHRERMVNLKIPSYVGSKLAVLGGVSLVQCLLLLVIVRAGCDLSGPWLPTTAVLVLTAVTGVALGLAVSALARSSEMAVSLVPLVLLPLVILGGMLRPVHEMKPLLRAAAAFTPSRWAFEGLVILESDQAPARPAPGPPGNPPPAAGDLDWAETFFPADHRSSLARVTLVQCSLLATLVAGVLAIMRRRDAH